MEDLILKEIAAVEGWTPQKHRRYADEMNSNAGNLRGSRMMAAQPPRTGTIRGVPR